MNRNARYMECIRMIQFCNILMKHTVVRVYPSIPHRMQGKFMYSAKNKKRETMVVKKIIIHPVTLTTLFNDF